MKRLLAITLCLVLVAVLAVPALASAPSISLSASASSAGRGDTVEITVSASGGGAAKAGGIEISCDTACFEMVSGQWLLSGASLANFIPADKTGAYAFAEEKTLSGKIFKFTLRIKSDAEFKSGSVTVKLTVKGQGTSSQTTGITVSCKHSYGGWSKVNSSSHSHTCSICGKTETKNHSYDNACDTKCNGCGATRSITHQYEETWSSDDAVHFHKCGVCGARKDETPHTPGAEATVAAPQTCTECQHILVPSLEHDHILQPGLEKDETGHWAVCTLCPNQVDLAEHIYSAECDEDCDECGYLRETVHTQGTEQEADGENHWYPCTVCGKHMEEEKHIGDMTDPEPVCQICDHAMVHTHDYSKDWSASLEEHWHSCLCGDREEVALHTWTQEQIREYPTFLKDGLAVFTCEGCGGENEVRIPALYRSALSLLILCGVLALVFLGMLITLIVIFVKMNRKPRGKFSAAARKREWAVEE